MKKLLPIEKVARKIGLKKEELEFYGPYKAKILGNYSSNAVRSSRFRSNNNLVLVTAMTPGKFGEGKTTTSIGLSDALWQLGKKSIVVLREPSMGPCFGMKGGATGGGKAMIEPADDINYHFTGDIHAVTSAHNLLSSMLDNSLYFETLNLETDSITWPRVLDLNDRALRHIQTTMLKKNGSNIVQNTRFDISVTSEVMAILGLARDEKDLRTRLARIIVGFSKTGQPITAKMLKADGAMAFLLKDALKPNLVQTLEGNPAIIHGGPFANIAHGTASLISIKTALQLSEYTLVEAGFAADLGGEKFLDIVCRVGDLHPKIAVLIATARAVEEGGLENLERHLRNLQNFGLSVVLCINRFDSDSSKTIKEIKDFAEKQNLPFAESFVFQKGGAGGLELAKEIIKACKTNSFILRAKREVPGGSSRPSASNNINYTYNLSDSPQEKILKLCQKIYGAKDVEYFPLAASQLAKFGSLCAGLYICMAKTQYSFSHDPKLLGAPKDYVFKIKEIRLSAGANFLIPIAGEIMTMPGLPRQPLAEKFL